jgi:predicted metal-dependent RNase
LDVSVAQEKTAPYSEADVKNALLHAIPREYREVTDIAPDIRLTLHNASHILGSSSVHLNIGEGAHNLVYSADIKYGMTRLFDNIDVKYPRIETLIIESTYGSKDAVQMTREEAEQKLIEIIQETTQFGGNVLIPVFGVGRGQEICMVIEDAYKRGLLSEKNSIYVEGMVKEASAVHTAYPEFLRQSLEKRILTNDSPFDSELFKEAKREDREKICAGSGAVIITTSGMMNGGPVIDYFYKLAENSANTLVFVGYLAEGTFGRKIQQGLKTFPISDNGKTKKLEVKMRVETIDGFSGHADFNQLSGYVASLKPKPKKILVDHGDPMRAVEFSKYCAAKFGISSSAIRNLEAVRLK